MRFLDQPFGSEAVLRRMGSVASRIEHGRQDFHIVPEDEVLLVLNLTASHRITGRFDGRFESETPLLHSVSVMPPGHRFDFDVEGRCRILAVTVPSDGMTVAVVEPRFNVTDPQLAALIWRAAIRDDVGIGLGLADLRRHLVKPRTARTDRVALPAARLGKVLRFIEGELANPVSTADLAAVAGMSTFHFSRAFTVATGITPHRYVLGRRLAHAVAAIEKGCVLEEAAFTCGFANGSHLALHLRRGTGATSRTLRTFLRD